MSLNCQGISHRLESGHPEVRVIEDYRAVQCVLTVSVHVISVADRCRSVTCYSVVVCHWLCSVDVLLTGQ